jgi:hypothetical protein
MPQLDRSLLPRNSRVTTHVCLHCEVTFFSTKPKTKYCSSKCRVYAHLDRKALKAQEDSAKEYLTETTVSEPPKIQTIIAETPKVEPPIAKADIVEPTITQQLEEEAIQPPKPETKKEPPKQVLTNQMSLF